MKGKVIFAVTNDMYTDQRVHRICNSLVAQGLDVLVFARELPYSSKLEKRNYIVKRFKPLFQKGFLFYATFNLRLFLFLIFNKANAITANDLDTLPACSIASKLKNIPLIFDSHEYFPEVPELLNRKIVKKIWEIIEKLFIRNIKYASTVSESIAEIYNNKYGLNMQVVRNFPLLNNTKETNHDLDKIIRGRKLIIYQGALNLGRGIENILDALTYLNDTLFLIVGKGDIEEELKQKVKNLSLEDKVYFTGRIPLNKLREYTLKADLGVSFEENIGLNYYYALPNKIFDYIHSGVPVLSSALPEMKKIVEKYNVGIATDVRNPQQLAQIINEMLFNKEKRKVWINNTTSAAIELSWDKEESKIINLYKKVLL